MKIVFCVVLLSLLCAVVPAQKADLAIATYAKNGRIIGITNLSGLSDCKARSAVGKVSSVDVEGDRARISLKEKKVSTDVEIPLNRLSADDRALIFKQFVSKKARLRVAGYSCEPEGAIVAFSVDRVY